MSTIPIVKNDAPTQLGGRRRKKNGGEDPEIEFNMGGKKKNGHKTNCACPICVNMKHAKGTKRNRHNKRGGSKRRRGGGDDDDDEESAEASANADVSGSDASASARDARVARAPSNPNSTTPNGDSSENVDTTGGRRRKKSNGHKANCKCPICKNMKKSKRGGNDEDGDIENQKGDIEEGFVKGEKIVDIETKAGDDDYEEIEQIQKMEEGEGPGPYNPQAYENVGGRRRKGKSRKNKSKRNKRRTRRHRRR